MYAIIQVGSGQYKVSQGDTIETQIFTGKEGESVQLEQVLLVADDSSVKIGQPFLKDAKVSAKILGRVKTDRVLAFKFRRRKDSSTRKGHRQNLTRLSITKISAGK